MLSELGYDNAPDQSTCKPDGPRGHVSRDPEAERFYPEGHNDRMPAFAKHPQEPKQNTLTADEIELLVSWLRGEWYEPGREVNAAAAAETKPTAQTK